MATNKRIIEQIKSDGLMPLFYHDDEAICVSIAQALYKGGSRIIEFTNRGKNALQNFKALVAERNSSMPDLLLAIGTIHTANEAAAFIDAGADMLVSPFFDAGVLSVAQQHDKTWMPGCMTATEIHRAQTAGCNIVKIFPGNIVSPAFVTAVKPLFAEMDFVVTGGVDATAESIDNWFTAGVCAVGMGSNLISKKMMGQKEYAGIEKLTTEILQITKRTK